MNSTILKSVKKTGYDDIDNLLVEAHKLIQEGNKLQRDIDVAVKFKPINPFNSQRKKFKIKFSK